MNLLPFENYHFTSPLSKAEVLGRLENITESTKITLLGNDRRGFTKPYEGEIAENSFVIQKNIVSVSKSLLPLIQGEIKENVGQTEVYIKMSMNKLMSVSQYIVMVVFGYLVLFVIVEFVMYQHLSSSVQSLILIVPSFYMLSVFKKECNKTKTDLHRLLS